MNTAKIYFDYSTGAFGMLY